MTDEIDTSGTTEIKGSPKQLMGLVLLSAMFVALGLFLLLIPIGSDVAVKYVIQGVGLATIAFFGLGLGIGLKRMLSARGTVITLGPEGIRDIRVSHDLVPWSAIEKLAIWQHSGQKGLLVALKPGEQDKLRLTKIASMTRGANTKLLGEEGLALTALGTEVSHNRLVDLASAYAERYQGRS